jgi:hypothetical protein
LVEAGIEQQACLGLYRFHEAAVYQAVSTIARGYYFGIKHLKPNTPIDLRLTVTPSVSYPRVRDKILALGTHPRILL